MENAIDFRKELSILEQSLKHMDGANGIKQFEKVEAQIVALENRPMSNEDNRMSGFAVCPQCKGEDIHSEHGISGTGGNYATDRHKCICGYVWDNYYCRSHDNEVYDAVQFEYLTKDETIVKDEYCDVYYYEEYRAVEDGKYY